jgi:uncharacterized protein YciI
MKHFIIDIHYLIPAEQLGETTAEHRTFLQSGYKQGLLLFSGPKVPRTGGIIVARAESANKLVEFFRNDPYQKKGVATYQFIEFNPVFKQEFLEEWVVKERE